MTHPSLALDDAHRDAAPPPPPPAWRSWAILVLMMVLGGSFAVVAVRYALPVAELREAKRAGRAAVGGAYGAVLALQSIVLLWLVIALHEVGHLVGGAVARFRFELFVAGPLRVARDEDGVVRWGLNRDLAFAGGVALALPDDAVALRRRSVYLVAGGPIASVIVSALGFAIVRAGGHGPFAFFALGTIAIGSAGIAMATLIPARSGGMASDGLRLLRLARGGPAADRDAVSLPLVGLARTGVRPRDWPATLVDGSLAVRDATVEECVAQLFAYLHRLDSGRTAEAGVALDRCLALADGRYPKSHIPLLKLEGAYYAAAHRSDALGARALMAAVPEKSPLIPAMERARAEAAIRLAEGDRTGAAEAARRGIAAAPEKSPFTRARLEELLARAEGVAR